MTVDHIGVFIPNTPMWLRYIGRLAAPLFFFCVAEGFFHTRDKKKYVVTMYKMSVLMSLICVLIPQILFDGGIIANNIFSSIFQAVLILYLFEITKEDKPKRKKYFGFYLLYQIVVLIVWVALEFSGFFSLMYGLPVLGSLEYILVIALGSVFFTEGSLILTGMIILFYFSRDNKKKLTRNYLIYCVLYFLIFVPQFAVRGFGYLRKSGLNEGVKSLIQIAEIPFGLLGIETLRSAGNFAQSAFNVNFQWMMIFALPFMLLYNGKKGKGYKKLFYIYYPLHIVILYSISYICL